MSAPFDPADVVTTDRLDAYIDDARRPMLNNYTRHAKIGDGHHGEVYLCYQLNTRLPEGHADRRLPVAMKSVKRDNPRAKQFRKLRQQRLPTSAHTPLVDRLGTTEAKIRKEIAIMKKCRHPHVVRLYEVIDDRTKEKIYMVMEYLAGGEVKWTNAQSQPILSYDQTRRIIRDAVLGLEYLHHQGIIHRDIKPANLLYTQDRCQVKIADFGVSHFSYAQRLAAAGAPDHTEDILLDDSDLTKRAGTPSFLAPEIVYEHTNDPSPAPSSSSPDVPTTSALDTQRPPVTKSIDVWALGVTLYCLLFGRTPFTADPAASGTEWSLYNSICNLDWTAEETMCSNRIPTGGRHPADTHTHTPGGTVICLLDRLLKKDPKTRITLDQIKRHEWILQDIPEPGQWLRLTMPKGKINVSADETSDAMSAIRFQWNWNSVARRVSSLFRRPREHGHGHGHGHGHVKPTVADADRGESADVEAVKSDPYAGVKLRLRRHQSARLPDDFGYPLCARTHVHGKRDKGKQRESLHPPMGETNVRPKSTEPWPTAGRGRGNAGTSTSASRSTSAIPFRRRGSGSILSTNTNTTTERTTTSNNLHRGTNNNNNNKTGRSSFISSVTTSPSTSPSTSTSPITSTSLDKDRVRARFSNFFTIKHWRPNKFSPSPHTSTSTAATTASSAGLPAAPVFSRTNTDGTITITRRSEEVLRQYQHQHQHQQRQYRAPGDDGGVITAERRASSWGQEGGLSAASSFDFLRPAAGVGVASWGGGGAVPPRPPSVPGGGLYGDRRFAPRTPSMLSTNLATADAEAEAEADNEMSSPASDDSPAYTPFTPSDEASGRRVGRRASDRFGPACYDEDSSTIASASVSGEGRWAGGSASASASASASEDDGDEELELEFGEGRREDEDEDEGDEDEDEDEEDDEDDDDSDQEHGVVFSPRKRPPQRALEHGHT